LIVSYLGCEVKVIGTEASIRDKHDSIVCRRVADGAIRSYYIYQLRADNGIEEIQEAVKAAGGKMEVFK
jgi:hypothetical protein